MKANKVIDVFYNQSKVGTLALGEQKKIFFQYDAKWLENGFSINPFSLPLTNEVFAPKKNFFEG